MRHRYRLRDLINLLNLALPVETLAVHHALMSTQTGCLLDESEHQTWRHRSRNQHQSESRLKQVLSSESRVKRRSELDIRGSDAASEHVS